MAVDLTGGLDTGREYVFPKCPSTPAMRESVNMWVSDDRGVLGLPRFSVEALAPNWDEHDLSVNIAFPSGRVISMRGKGKAHPTIGPDGKSSVFGAGPMEFRCLEPFRSWTVTFNGPAIETSASDQANAKRDGRPVDLEFQIETTMAVPSWAQGHLISEAGSVLDKGIEGDFMGGLRYEQLFRASGTLRIDDEKHAFRGSGLRIRRQGVRNTEGFWGHCWQSALFPSGRAFGVNSFPPRADGKPTYNEGFIFERDGTLIPARVVEAQWIRKLQHAGEDVSLVLETKGRRVRIEGETILSTYTMGHPQFPMALQQAGARYRWDGEETFGMIERSTTLDTISR